MSNKSNSILCDVSFIRPILIVLLVVYHAFIIYRGGWEQPVGFHENTAYWWIANVSYSFMLETFVFISGYVYAFKTIEKRVDKTFISLVIEKIKRLLIPSIVFSIIYLVVFNKTSSTVLATVYSVFNGVGHMWFLPMLFWCFIFVYAVRRINIPEHYKVVLLFLVAIISYLPLPFRLDSVMYYFSFFYLGYYIRWKKLFENVNIVSLLISWTLFVVLFVSLVPFENYLQQRVVGLESYLVKAFLLSLSLVCRVLYALIGCLALFVTSKYVTACYKLPQWVVKLGTYCFGVYLFQQFILMFLYYHTNLPLVVGYLWLPWVGFIITIVGSLLLSWLLRSTTIGKKLI